MSLRVEKALYCSPLVTPTVKNTACHCLLQNILPRYGIENTMVDGNDVNAYRNAVKSNTKVLFAETPCNPTMGVLDLEEFGRLGKSLQVITMVDSTLATPFVTNPIRHGVDIVLHSCSKYIGGHSDIIAGAMIASSKQLVSQIFEYQKIVGPCLSPFDGFLLMRGIRTLHLRMEKHCANAMAIALLLENHPKVDKVFYPGLTSHPNYSIAVKQMRGFGGLLAFSVKGGLEEAKKFSESVKLFKLAGSLGGTDSLVEVVCLMTHNEKYISPEEREALGIPESMIRLSVGLAHVEDLKKDIEQALATLT
ncbi:uncharacterized protein LOC110237887 isoform X2 [Exaiptasia diaphana]|uniref:Cystathionine gamma-lyase n=1 Tax=Exaiptasia diaphana TaxID=2652724 RepID=A0A913X5A2_EXADI|nr:uncharacterized protein LOC110237887 isoform X2 [Exaiptasia diaphana]